MPGPRDVLRVAAARSRDGLVAVGTVVMNRLQSGEYGNSVCGVVGGKGQFAPGVLSRPDGFEGAARRAERRRGGARAASAIRKVKDAMFFHTAGLKFPYKNMHYVLVAGGNAFYEKRGRDMPPMPAPQPVAVGRVAVVPRSALPEVARLASAAVAAAERSAADCSRMRPPPRQ